MSEIKDKTCKNCYYLSRRYAKTNLCQIIKLCSGHCLNSNSNRKFKNVYYDNACAYWKNRETLNVEQNQKIEKYLNQSNINLMRYWIILNSSINTDTDTTLKALLKSQGLF